MYRWRNLLVLTAAICCIRISASEESTTLPATSPASQPSTAPTVGPAAVNNVKEIETVLTRLIESAASRADFDTLTSFLSRPDRDRIGELRMKTWPDLDGRIDEFRKDWRAKYAQDFKMTDKASVVFSNTNCRIVEGSVEADLKAPVGQAPATSEAATTTPSTRNAALVKSATVNIDAVRGCSAVTLKMVNEGTLVPSWRVDVPDTIDGQRLHDNVLAHLTAFDEDRYNWPADVNDAYNLIAHHVIAGLADAPVAATQPTTNASTRPTALSAGK